MAFDDVSFPIAIALDSEGGPEFSTDVIETAGGFEKRNQNWSGARLRFNVARAVKTVAQYESLLKFFRGRAGKARAFRFPDWSDFKSCDRDTAIAATDQIIGQGDGAKQFFQLQKSYPAGPVTNVRKITRPRLGTVAIALGGIEQSSGWSVDVDIGLIRFDVPPPSGVVVTAGYEFDVPARFDTDRLEPSYPFEEYFILPDLPIVEVRE